MRDLDNRKVCALYAGLENLKVKLLNFLILQMCMLVINSKCKKSDNIYDLAISFLYWLEIVAYMGIELTSFI